MAKTPTVTRYRALQEQISPTRAMERHKEFVTLLVSSHDRLLGYLMSLLGRWHDAQDVLQSSSLLMWQKFETFESGTDFVAWGSTICFYEAKNFQRRAARSPLKFDDDLLEVLSAERVVDADLQERRTAALELCLKEVSSENRRILQAAYSQHGKIVELAASLGRSPRTLYNKLTLLRSKLAQCVQHRMQENAV